MVAGEASGDLLAGLLLGGLQARWPALQADGIGGPRMAAQGFEAWWPHDKLAVRGYVEVLSHYREISGIRQAAGRPPARRPAGCLHRRRCARLQPRPRGAAEGARRQDHPLRQPVDLGLARRADREDPARHRPRAVHVSVRAGRSTRRRASRPPMSAIRWPRRSRSRCRACRAGRASASAPRTPSSPCCPAVAAPRSSTSRRACSPRPSGCIDSGRACASSCRWCRACATLIEPMCTRARAEDAGRPARRPLARGAGGLRRDADRERHRDARSGAVQAADGHRLRDACAELADHASAWRTSRGSALPNILLRDFAVARAAAGRCDARTHRRPRRCAWLDDPAACAALAARFRALHDTLRCDTAKVATDAIEKVLAR